MPIDDGGSPSLQTLLSAVRPGDLVLFCCPCHKNGDDDDDHLGCIKNGRRECHQPDGEVLSRWGLVVGKAIIDLDYLYGSLNVTRSISMPKPDFEEPIRFSRDEIERNVEKYASPWAIKLKIIEERGNEALLSLNDLQAVCRPDSNGQWRLATVRFHNVGELEFEMIDSRSGPQDFHRDKLGELIARNGIQLIQDTIALRGALLDAFLNQPNHDEARWRVDTLVLVAEDGGVEKLLRTKDEIPFGLTVAQIIQSLHTQRRIEESALRWAVDSWAFALGVLPECEFRPFFESSLWARIESNDQTGRLNIITTAGKALFTYPFGDREAALQCVKEISDFVGARNRGRYAPLEQDAATVEFRTSLANTRTHRTDSR